MKGNLDEAFENLRKEINRANEERRKALEEKYGGRVLVPEEFWKEREGKEYGHICDVSLEELKERHRDELSTIDSREKAVEVGIRLMGDHYLDGFSSRSCSSRMAELVGYETNYMDFYCAGAEYYWIEQERRLKGDTV